jgi:hypothetical protein
VQESSIYCFKGFSIMGFGGDQSTQYWRIWIVVLSVLMASSSISVAVEAARPSALFSSGLGPRSAVGARKLSFLVNTSLVIPYHDGPLLSGSLSVYLIWYGTFTPAQQSIVRDLLASFQATTATHPSVSEWWSTTANYKDAANTVVGSLQLKAEVEDAGSLGKSLQTADLETLLAKSLDTTFPKDTTAIYMILTAEDILVENFCTLACASHFYTAAQPATNSLQLPYAWVGNSATQCPGQCAWPFALPEYGPEGAKPLIPPNGDVGMDGMCINIGTMLAGTATDPFNSGYYQGDPASPLEAATACTGIYGNGAYPGYPGDLLQDKITGASFNAYGVNNREFLLPAIWDPVTLQCTP